MPKAEVYNLKRERVGDIDLSDKVFGAEVNEALFYEVVKAQLASKRQGTAAVKNRALVAATSKKLYKQKGTGSARHGNKAAPSFVGGGVAHGPKVRSYAYRPNRKMRIGALRSALSMMHAEGKLTIVDDFKLEAIKTKALMNVLNTLKVGKSAVVVDTAANDELRLSIRNLPKFTFLPPEGVNVYDLLRHQHLVIAKSAISALEARCAMSKKNAGNKKAKAGAA